MSDARSTVVWPVRWEPLLSQAMSAGATTRQLLDDPNLAALRVLDRLASMGADAVDGVRGSVDAFVAAFAQLRRAIPGLPEDADAGPTAHAAATRARVVLAVNDDDGARAAAASEDRGSAGATLLDRHGVNALEVLAFRLAGRSAAAAVRRLTVAERLVLDRGNTRDREFLADVAALTGGVADGSPWHPQDGIDAARLVAAAPSACEATFDRVFIEDLDANPPPQGSPISTTGIERVEVDGGCSASPGMTIHGHGFGITPGGRSLLVATWDAHERHVAYRAIAVSNWSDTTIVANLPSDVVSGTAAFCDLAFIQEYNDWVDARNDRIAATMHADGCPGAWVAEAPFAQTPEPVPAAAYTAGGPQVIADVAPTVGAPELWNRSTLHLEAGQAFRVGWLAINADSVVLKPLDDAGRSMIVAVGGSDSGIALDPAGGDLVLTAGSVPTRATVGVEARNQCGFAQAPLNLMVTVPALQDATTTVYQSVAGGDVKVTNGPTGEALDPAVGSTIPLVAGKRSVAVIDWWAAIPQMPPGEQVIATATLEVSGPLVGETGVTLWPGATTSDDTPSDVSVELPAGPGFPSLAAYQQWVAAGKNPQTFNVVLPAQLCQGGLIPGTDIQGWTVLSATVTVVCLNGPAWTLTPGNNVIFHKRRPVRIRYRAWGWTQNLPPGKPPLTAPPDQACRAAVKGAGSLLPIPDPEIIALPNSPVEHDGHLVEDLFAQRGGTVTPQWRDEIWLVIGAVGTGGVSLPAMPWISATDATALTIAHEICHEFGQNHLALCGLIGDPPSSFPNNGNVVVPGFDMWNNTFVRNALDIMVRTYCPEPTWPSPERWRRVFLQVGPP